MFHLITLLIWAYGTTIRRFGVAELSFEDITSFLGLIFGKLLLVAASKVSVFPKNKTYLSFVVDLQYTWFEYEINFTLNCLNLIMYVFLVARHCITENDLLLKSITVSN